MRTKPLMLFSAALLLFAGCGVNKDYVAQQISESEARTSGEINTLRDKTDGNAAEISKLQSLASQLSDKTDMAINKAKGFENYQIIWEGVVNFDFDSYAITGIAEQTLVEAGEKMEQSPGSIIEIAGHSDPTGSSSYNMLLGEKRANSAKRFLNDRFGTSLYRMFVISYGEEKPTAMLDENQSASKNRRVTLRIWGEL